MAENDNSLRERLLRESELTLHKTMSADQAAKDTVIKTYCAATCMRSNNFIA